MGIFDSYFEKGERYEASGEWKKAAEFYKKAIDKDPGNYTYKTKLYVLALAHPYEAASALKMMSQYLIEEAMDYFKWKVSDAGMAAIINYWLHIYNGNSSAMRWVDQWEKVEECLNLINDNNLRKKLLEDAKPLYEKAIVQKQKDINWINTQTEEEKRLGIKRINKPGGFYSVCEIHPNERLIDLKKGTNYNGMYTDNYYDNAYQIKNTISVNGWSVTYTLDTLKDPIIKGNVCMRGIKVTINEVVLSGSGYNYYESEYDLSSSDKLSIESSFLESSMCTTVENAFLKDVAKLFGIKYASGYELSVSVTQVDFKDTIYFKYLY